MSQNMDMAKDKLREDFQLLLTDARRLADAAQGELGDKGVEAKARLQETLRRMEDEYGRLRGYGLEHAKKAENFIAEHPFQSVGIGFLAGALFGLLAGRK